MCDWANSFAFFYTRCKRSISMVLQDPTSQHICHNGSLMSWTHTHARTDSNTLCNLFLHTKPSHCQCTVFGHVRTRSLALFTIITMIKHQTRMWPMSIQQIGHIIFNYPFSRLMTSYGSIELCIGGHVPRHLGHLNFSSSNFGVRLQKDHAFRRLLFQNYCCAFFSCTEVIIHSKQRTS